MLDVEDDPRLIKKGNCYESCLSEQGLKVKECSDLFGVGQRTVERRMSSFGPSVSGERFSVLFYSFDCILYIF